MLTVEVRGAEVAREVRDGAEDEVGLPPGEDSRPKRLEQERRNQSQVCVSEDTIKSWLGEVFHCRADLSNSEPRQRY